MNSLWKWTLCLRNELSEEVRRPLLVLLTVNLKLPKDGFQTDEVPCIYFVRSTRLITEHSYVMITDRQDLGMQERRWWVQTVSDKGSVPELPQQHVEQQLGVWRVQSSSHQVSPDARSSGSRSSKQQKNLKNLFMSWFTSSSETVHLTVLIYYAFSILNNYIIH